MLKHQNLFMIVEICTLHYYQYHINNYNTSGTLNQNLVIPQNRTTNMGKTLLKQRKGATIWNNIPLEMRLSSSTRLFQIYTVNQKIIINIEYG